jgi:hypothetical protein
VGYADSVLIELTEPVQRNAILGAVSLEQMTGPRVVEPETIMG